MRKLIIVFIQIIFCYFICELASFTFELHRALPYCGDGKKFISYFFDNIHLFWENEFANFDKNYQKLVFRPIAGAEHSSKKPIVLFGCSFVHGVSLNDEQLFSFKLSKFLKRKVYNRAYFGWGPQNMLYQLRRSDFYSIVKEEPEFAIYTYTSGHLERIYREVWGFETQTFYTLANNNLKESYFVPGKFPLYGYFAKQIRHFISIIKLKNNENSYKFMLKHFEETEKEIKKHWENTKFVVFIYNATDDEKEMLKRMRKEKGFNIIFLDEISKINISTLEYRISETDAHPNEKAWDTIVPLLVNKLNIK